MKYPTLQSAFDAAVAGLAAQDFRKSADIQDSCLYFSENHEGDRCAVGHLMPDDWRFNRVTWNCSTLFDVMEAFQAEDIIPCYFADSPEYTAEDHLASLQAKHDTSINPDHMRKRLREYAIQHNLAIPAILEVETAA